MADVEVELELLKEVLERFPASFCSSSEAHDCPCYPCANRWNFLACPRNARDPDSWDIGDVLEYGLSYAPGGSIPPGNLARWAFVASRCQSEHELELVGMCLTDDFS